MKQTLFKTLLAFSLFTAAACYSTQAAPGDLYDGGLSDQKIYKFDTAGNPTVFVSDSATFQPDWLAFDSKGNLFASNPAHSAISKIPPNGSTITDFATGISPGDLAFDAAGNLFAIDGTSGSIFKYTPLGARTTFAGPGFNDFVALAFASDGSLFVTRRGSGAAGSGSIVKFAASCTSSCVPSTFFPTPAQPVGLFLPKDLAFDSFGNLYEADSGSGSVFKFAPNGTKTTFNTTVLNAPQSLAFDRDGNLFVGECPSPPCDIVKFTPAGGTPSVFASPPAIGGIAFEPPAAYDFNQDGKRDYVLYNAVTHQTAVWYLNNNIFVGGAFGPTLPANWKVVGVADFDADGRPDYLLFNSTSHQTAIWYLSGTTLVSGAFGPSLPNGWDLVAVGDFNADGKPDYVLYNAVTHQTAIWYLNNNAFVSGVFGPTLPVNWRVVGVADFNGDNKPDYLLFNSSTGQTAIWYLSGPTFVAGAFGPSIVSGYTLIGAADFDRDGKPDYALYSSAVQRTAVWYLNNNALTSGAYGPSLPGNWSLIAP